MRRQDGEIHFLSESLSALQVQLENIGWQRLGAEHQWDFNYQNIITLRATSRLLTIKNPLIKRSVEVQVLYVWALGVTISGIHPLIDGVIQEFLEDPKNYCEIGSKVAREELEKNQQVFGCTYHMFFVNQDNGFVRFRAMDPDQITDIFRNPDDYKENWFYQRTMVNQDGKQQITWYPDWKYMPQVKEMPLELKQYATAAPVVIDWEKPIRMTKTGHTGAMKFGLPEIYAAFDWALAYKDSLENWLSIQKAHARMSMQLVAKSGKTVAAAKSKVESASDSLTNVAGFVASTSGFEVKAIKTAGATTPPSEAYAIMTLVAAAAGLPGTFYGDADVGNFATSATLDRPTELKMVSRQGFWADWFKELFDFVIDWASIAPNGPLAKAGAIYTEEIDSVTGQICYDVEMPMETNKDLGEVGKPINREVAVTFPDILERSVADSVRAGIGALTLNGNQPTDVLQDRRLMAEVLIKLLGFKDWKSRLDKMYPPGTATDPILPPMAGGNGFGQGNPADPKQVGKAPANTPVGKKQGA